MSATRRGFLLGAAALALSRGALARGRTAQGGSVKLHMPWSVATLDPHALDDPAAAILGDALFDTLYARQEGGEVVPQLAETEPSPSGGALRVALRQGLHSAFGRPIDAHDAATSISRARANGARGWLAGVPAPRVDGNTLVFPMTDASILMRALASPLVAIVPGNFSPARPDGTGPFRATRNGDALVLVRNANAARGPAFLEQIVVRTAPALETSLRAFEEGADDVGWHGSGYFETRAGSRPWDCGAVGWAVLRTGLEAGTQWGAPGVAQSICDAVPPGPLAPLRLGPAWTPSGAVAWGGPACDLLVREDSAWLTELARSLAATLSSSGSAVTARPIPQAELARRRALGAFALALDVVRPLFHGTQGALASLATADDPQTASAQRLPRTSRDANARSLTRTMRVGVVGEIRVLGGRVPDLVLPATAASFGVDFGASRRGG